MKTSIYQVFPRVELPDRRWPQQTISQAPTWCSIDLSAGDQALPNPMSLEQKLMLFGYLVSIGFKQIEIGIPGSSDTDYLFLRRLIEDDLIPEDVTIQVVSQLKEKVILKTYQALAGCKKAIIHLFKSTSLLRREQIFDVDAERLIAQTCQQVELAKSQAAALLANCQYQFSFSPEGFNTTEPTLLSRLCQSVIEIIAPSTEKPMILNLLAAVETDLPNYFADHCEHLIQSLKTEKGIIFSVQTHNDRGGAVASSELALLAGVERVEGCLLANGARAGGCCLVTMALNLYSLGIEPNLDLSDLNQLSAVVEHCTGMACPPRHPYAGDLAFTAFSAPHQFAIHEAYRAYCDGDKSHWQVPYLPIDPNDVGRGDQDIIRLNATSGRTGIRYVMEKKHGYFLPRGMQDEFSQVIKQQAHQLAAELTAEQVWTCFANYYFKGKKILELVSIGFEHQHDGELCEAQVQYEGQSYQLQGKGSGVLDTAIAALQAQFKFNVDVIDYYQHALGYGATATAVSYVQLVDAHNNKFWGVGCHADTTLSSLDALFCAINKKLTKV